MDVFHQYIIRETEYVSVCMGTCLNQYYLEYELHDPAQFIGK